MSRIGEFTIFSLNRCEELGIITRSTLKEESFVIRDHMKEIVTDDAIVAVLFNERFATVSKLLATPIDKVFSSNNCVHDSDNSLFFRNKYW